MSRATSRAEEELQPWAEEEQTVFAEAVLGAEGLGPREVTGWGKEN
jgi:hypothetical protein